MKKLEGKCTVITGGSDGIGFGIATLFAQEGSNLLLLARNPKKLKEASENLRAFGVKVEILSADLSDPAEIRLAISRIKDTVPVVDVLINNAGIARFVNFEKVTEEELKKQMELNVHAPYLLIQGLMDQLKESSGCVINISSYFAQRMLPGMPSSVYSMSKGALNSLTISLAYELGCYGIRVNAIAPGTVNTSLVRSNIARLTEDQKRNFHGAIKVNYPMARLGEPEDIAGAALYLASSEAGWVTGAIFNIDGGLRTT